MRLNILHYMQLILFNKILIYNAITLTQKEIMNEFRSDVVSRFTYNKDFFI